MSSFSTLLDRCGGKCLLRMLVLLLAPVIAAPMLAWLAPASAADAPHFGALTPPNYTITDIGLLHEGDNGYGPALNILGEVVGSMVSAPGDWSAFLYRRGQLVAPVGPGSFATAINAQSQMIGWFDTLLNPGYLYDARHHRLQRFKFIPVAINNLGQVLLSGSPPRLYQPDGTLVDLSPLLGPDAAVSAINDLGQIAGFRGFRRRAAR